MSFTVECCKRRGMIPGGALICPICDYGPGDAGPPADRVEDVPEDVSTITNVILTVGGTSRTVGWVADWHDLPHLLEAVAAEMKAIREERS